MMIDTAQYHPHPMHDLKVKVTDSKLLLTSLFPNPLMDLVYVCYDDRQFDTGPKFYSVPSLPHA